MNEFLKLVAESSALLKRNYRFALLYVVASATMDFLKWKGILGSYTIVTTLLTIYILCGVLGCLTEDILEGNESTFADFHVYAKTYFWRAVGISILIGLIVVVPFAVITLSGRMPEFDFDKMPVLMTALYAVGGALLLLWNAGSVCCLVYYDGHVMDSLKGGIYVAFVNWRICIPLFIYTAFSVALVKLVPEGSKQLMYFVSVTSGIIWSSLMVVAYAYIMLNFSRGNLPRTVE